jgi:hypothetical protein
MSVLTCCSSGSKGLDACALMSTEELSILTGLKIAALKPKTSSDENVEVSSCLYSSSAAQGMQSIKVTLSRSKVRVPASVNLSNWIRNAAGSTIRVSGLGADVVWDASENELAVVKKEVFFTINLDVDPPDQMLDKGKNIARHILSKLP